MDEERSEGRETLTEENVLRNGEKNAVNGKMIYKQRGNRGGGGKSESVKVLSGIDGRDECARDEAERRESRRASRWASGGQDGEGIEWLSK